MIQYLQKVSDAHGIKGVFNIIEAEKRFQKIEEKINENLCSIDDPKDIEMLCRKISLFKKEEFEEI